MEDNVSDPEKHVHTDTEVEVEDVISPRPPEDDLDALANWIQGPYREKRKAFIEASRTAETLKDKGDIVRLGFLVVLFRSELDPWLAQVGYMIDNAKSTELSLAYQERQEEAEEKKLKRPSSDLVKAQADQLLAPLKRAQKELSFTQDLLSKTLSWCQSLQRLIAADEFGELYTGYNKVPEDFFSEPPSLAENIKRTR